MDSSCNLLFSVTYEYKAGAAYFTTINVSSVCENKTILIHSGAFHLSQTMALGSTCASDVFYMRSESNLIMII